MTGAGCEQVWALAALVATIIPSLLTGAIIGVAMMKVRARRHENPPSA